MAFDDHRTELTPYAGALCNGSQEPVMDGGVPRRLKPLLCAAAQKLEILDKE
jgi:hypothetical protein